MRLNTGNQLLHYFHFFAASNRIDVCNLSIKPPLAPVITPKECATSLLPTAEDDKAILDNFITLISRTLAAHLELLGFDCSKLVEWHIPHEYEEQMSRKSKVVSTHMIVILQIPLAIHNTAVKCN